MLGAAAGATGGGASVLTGRSSRSSGCGAFATSAAHKKAGNVNLSSGGSTSFTRGADIHLSAGTSPADAVGAAMRLVANDGAKLGGSAGVLAARGTRGTGGHATLVAGLSEDVQSGRVVISSSNATVCGATTGDCCVETGAATYGSVGSGSVHTGTSSFGSGGGMQIRAGCAHQAGPNIAIGAGSAIWGGSFRLIAGHSHSGGNVAISSEVVLAEVPQLAREVEVLVQGGL